MCLACVRNTSGCDRVIFTADSDIIATMHVECNKDSAEYPDWLNALTIRHQTVAEQGYAGYHELSDEAKDDIFDATNQIFHEAAAVWQYVDQGDPQEVEDVLQGVEEKVDLIRARIAEFKIQPTLNAEP
jgi:hypothetical protein